MNWGQAKAALVNLGYGYDSARQINTPLVYLYALVVVRKAGEFKLARHILTYNRSSNSYAIAARPNVSGTPYLRAEGNRFEYTQPALFEVPAARKPDDSEVRQEAL